LLTAWDPAPLQSLKQTSSFEGWIPESIRLRPPFSYDKDEPFTAEETVEVKKRGQGSESIGPVLLDSQTIQKRVRELGTQITGDYRGKTLLVVGILKGASIFHADLVRAIDLELFFDFIAVGSYGKLTKSSGAVRILKDLEESIEQKDVLLVEDIVDTGLTLHYLLQSLQARGPRSLKVVALLDKPSRREIDVPIEYVGFCIPDDFVVGYGLDYDQRYRNLPDICILRTR
jgi:hypoxanthine phosphoribosyltransferase